LEGVILPISGLESLGEILFEQFGRLEQILAALESQIHEPPAVTNSPGQAQPSPLSLPLDIDLSVMSVSLVGLQRQVDRVLFLHTITRAVDDLSLTEVIGTMMDALWQREQFAYGCIVLGESELGPYAYQDIRGVLEPRRYLGKKCPLPLWGELAHALVRRLDPEEADYLVIDDIAATGRPTTEEFPWMPRTGTLIILPLRKESVAIGALLLGRAQVSSLNDPELRIELVEFSDALARAVINAQTRQELDERAGQLVGLQLFTRSIASPMSLHGFLATVIEGIAELMSAASVLFTFQRMRLRPQLRQLLEETPGARVVQNLIGVGVVSIDEPMSVFVSLYPLFMWAIDAGQPLFFDPTQRVELPEDLYYNEVGQALIVPVAIGDIALGALYIESSTTKSSFDEGDMIVLRTATNAIAIALDRIG